MVCRQPGRSLPPLAHLAQVSGGWEVGKRLCGELLAGTAGAIGRRILAGREGGGALLDGFALPLAGARWRDIPLLATATLAFRSPPVIPLCPSTYCLIPLHVPNLG